MKVLSLFDIVTQKEKKKAIPIILTVSNKLTRYDTHDSQYEEDLNVGISKHKNKKTISECSIHSIHTAFTFQLFTMLSCV